MPIMQIASLHADLKRRGVYRVAGIYLVSAWVITEIVVSIEDPLQLPTWLDTAIILILALGFPISLLLSFFFDLTPQGIRSDQKHASNPDAYPPAAGAALMVVSIIIATLGFTAWQYYMIANDKPGITNTATAQTAVTDVSEPVPGFDGRKAIAVLPFENMSDDPGQGYLADGIAEDIITGLYAYQTFPVIARTSTFRYKGQSKDVRIIASELGAGYVLEGSVRRIGERVRITAQLIDANGEHLWAENYDRSWSSILQVQDDITYSILHSIEPALIRSETARSRRGNFTAPNAWDYYLQARALSAEEFSITTLSGVPVTRSTNDEAWRLANKALGIAPEMAAIYSLLSHIDGVGVLMLRGEYSPQEMGLMIERGLQNAAKARKLDPFEATACACQIVLLMAMGDVSYALEVGESALTHNPGSAFILAGLAKAVQVSGDFERALRLITKAKRLSPKSISMPTYLAFEALTRQSLGDMIGARRVARQALLLGQPRADIDVIRITSALAEGESDRAIQIMEAMRSRYPSYNPITSTWPEPFPQSVIDRVEEPLRSKLQGVSYAEGISITLAQLGWNGDW